MKNNYFIKKPKKSWIAILVLIFGLFVNEAVGQKVQTWTAATNTDWATATNWSQTGLTFNTTAAITTNTAVVNVVSTTGLTVGDTVTGTGIPALTTISSISSATQFTMSNVVPATVATATPLIFIFVTPLTGAVPTATDLAVLDNNNISSPVISGSVTVARLNISNTVGTVAGPTFTIPLGTTFNCDSSVASFITIAGGNIINNGTLSMTNVSMTVAGLGINFATPIQLPISPIEYGYSGTGLLKMNTPAITASNSAAIANTSANANTTIKLLFDGTNDFTLGATASAVVRNNGTSPLIIGGAGYTHGTVGTPKNGGLISLATGSTLTVNPETTLTLNSANTNLSPGIAVFLFQSMTSLNFTNKGNINIFGSSQRSGISIGIDATGLATPANAIVNFDNQNKIDVNLASISANQAALAVTVNGTNQGTVNILNTTTAVMNLKNNQPFGTNMGSALRITLGGSVPNVNFTNNGILNLTGTNTVYGGQSGTALVPRSQIINTGTITSNFEFQLFILTNSSTGTITFVNPVAAVNTKGASFIVPLATAVTAGDTYTDANSNIHTITATKASGTGITITTSTALAATVPSLGTLTKTNGAGTASIIHGAQITFPVLTATAATAGATYTNGENTFTVTTTKVANTGTSLVTYCTASPSVASGQTLTKSNGTAGTTPITTTAISTAVITTTSTVSPQSGALTLAMTNNGTVNTATGSTFLNVVSGVSDASTGTIAPGGTGYGIAELNKVASTPDGTLKIQVAGNTAAGVDYDQLRNSLAASTLSLTNLDLNISFLYTPTSTLSIPIVTGIAISNNFASVTGLKAGWELEYLSTVVNLKYTAGTTTAASWIGTTDSDWGTATNWSPAVVPTVSSDVTIPTASSNQPVIGSNVDINSLVIESGKSLTVNTGFNLAVTGIITNNGTLTINNNANLIQVDNITNAGTGTTTIKRNSNALMRLDFTSWSSPVTGSQTLAGFSPGTSQSPSRFYNYSETASQYTFIASPTTTPFATATGYLIRVPVAHPLTPTVWAGSFSGVVPNNGTITKAITYLDAAHGYNMVGNPYPSTIDAQTFIAANSANIESSLYFWRKTNGATGSSYAIYNPMGSTTATPTSALPNGTIQVGQGFFVKAKSASNLTFTNAMRVANNANQFFKTKEAQKDRVWLNLTTTSGAFSQALIGYTADATAGVDMYDAKYINDSPIALTSNINDEEYSIQGRPTFDATDVVALNFKTNVAGDYTIALDQFDGVFAAGQEVYLADSKTGAETDLKAGSYTFNAATGTDNTRFSLRYQKTLKVDAPALDENSISVYASNGTIYVSSKSVAISNIKVFDVQGRLLAEQNNVKSNTAVISDLRANNQVLIVKVAGEDNREVTKKLLN